MPNGERLGSCPTCGGHRWWDNRSRKATGEMARAEPDYRCPDCGHHRWVDGRHEPGRSTSRRTPAVTVTVIPPVLPADRSIARGTTCAALTRGGTPCRNGAMAGSPFCGPHTDGGGGARTAPNQCRGTTKTGQPCRAGAMRGTDHCPQHQPRRP